MACSRLAPHISADGCKPRQNAGRSGLPKMRQRSSLPSCTQRTPAGFPLGIPGIGLVIDGAVQHAPQPARQLGAAGAACMVGDSLGLDTAASITRRRAPQACTRPFARRRSALAITDTELRLIASAAIMGESNCPVNG